MRFLILSFVLLRVLPSFAACEDDLRSLILNQLTPARLDRLARREVTFLDSGRTRRTRGVILAADRDPFPAGRVYRFKILNYATNRTELIEYGFFKTALNKITVHDEHPVIRAARVGAKGADAGPHGFAIFSPRDPILRFLSRDLDLSQSVNMVVAGEDSAKLELVTGFFGPPTQVAPRHVRMATADGERLIHEDRIVAVFGRLDEG